MVRPRRQQGTDSHPPELIRELRELLGSNPPEYLEHFQFSILEIADFQTSDAEIDARESHWKEVLGSRVHGYNSN